MTALLVSQTVVVAVLGLLVVSLLRSHAEILRRLHEIDPTGGPDHDGADRDGADRDGSGRGGSGRGGHAHGPRPVDFGVRPGVALPRATETPAFDVAGTSPAGDDVAVAVVGARTSTLLAFLSSGCMTCQEFWTAFGRDDAGLPTGIRLVVLTKGEEQESRSRIAELAPAGTLTVMSSQAWTDYEVPMSPYFILVDGPQGAVRGEGAASSWSQLKDLMGQALDDGPRRRRGRRSGPQEREDRIDREMLAAGIAPGHPSLRPDAGAFGARRPS